MMRFITILLLIFPVCAIAQTFPEVDPTGYFIFENQDGSVDTTEASSGVQNAPLKVIFKANPSGLEGYGIPRYEWKIWNNEDPSNILIHRMEENIEYTFTSSGAFTAQLYVTFYNADGSICYEFPEEGEDPKTIFINISESILEFPNGISPNNDGWNDTLKPKDGYQSIVSFRAAVFNRWGTKLYSWDDVDGEWDGTYKGKVVKDGVYFLVVSAKGADGRSYSIKKTISVISGYNNGEGEAGTGDEEQ
ncbi:MAG: gliding motility-associated C-terminal domain-containing protein [Bacteroidaceae bacterium]|nr:gliding motility-associated C-terminal domain-containing protein [Bacteroidaceae bacterium]